VGTLWHSYSLPWGGGGDAAVPKLLWNFSLFIVAENETRDKGSWDEVYKDVVATTAVGVRGVTAVQVGVPR